MLIFLLNLVQLKMQATSVIIILVLFAFATDVWCRRHSRGRFHKSRYDDKIVGGTNDTVQNVPYIVYLLLQNKDDQYFQCGGSIISENYILTAAHCTKDIVKAYIRAGSTDADTGGDEYTSDTIKAHPLYNSRNLNNDVAVIRTTKPIRLDGITTKAIKLPKLECDITSGTNIKVSGWGVTQENGDVSSNLLSVVVQAVPNDVCSRQLGYNITTCQFCAGVPEGGKDACQGDSGGPGVVSASSGSRHKRKRTCSSQVGNQVGIVSSGIGCARPGKPGVYTRVSCATVRAWIKLTTGV